MQKVRRSPIRRPRDVSKSSSSSESSRPIVRRRGRSTSSDQGQSSSPVRKEAIQKEDMEPVEVAKRVYRKRSPSKSSASPSPQKVLTKREVQKRRGSTSSERMEMRRERSNERRRQRVEENLRREKNIRAVRGSNSPDRRRDLRKGEGRNDVVRRRDRSPSSSDAETLRKKLEDESKRKGKRRRSSSSGARSSRDRQAKKMTYRETGSSKQQPLHSRRETSSADSQSGRVDNAMTPKGENMKGREVERKKPARQASSESNDSRQPTPKKTIVEERRRVTSSKKEISRQRSMSSDEEARVSPQRKHVPKDERKSLDEKSRHKARHEGGECSNAKKVPRSSRSPVARKVAVVPPLKSKANESDSDDQGANQSRHSPYEEHIPKSDKVTSQRPMEKKFESDEENMRSKQVRKRASSAEASPDVMRKAKRCREDDNSDDSEEVSVYEFL